jgi:hypothetical protein
MRKPDPVELVAIGVPILLEAVAVVLFIGMIAVWVALASGRVPA